MKFRVKRDSLIVISWLYSKYIYLLGSRFFLSNLMSSQKVTSSPFRLLICLKGSLYNIDDPILLSYIVVNGQVYLLSKKVLKYIFYFVPFIANDSSDVGQSKTIV